MASMEYSVSGGDVTAIAIKLCDRDARDTTTIQGVMRAMVITPSVEGARGATTHLRLPRRE